MKKLFSTLSAILLVSFAAHSQVVINEILYNDPSSGTDVEEFIELHNTGATAVSLVNYTFTQGVSHTFTSGMIPAGGYFVLAVDSAAFHNAFGMAPDAEWASGGLSNGGEDITIYDANGVFVDSVNYDDAAPWPISPDGLGYSLQLCNPSANNNDGANWGTSSIGTGLSVTGTDSLYATPGMMNTCVVVIPPPPPSYPLYTFDQINDVDANGNADSLNVTCELRGIAHCIDLRGGSGLDFPFASSDNSAGVRIFSFTDVDAYSVTAGDSLHIWGRVSQFNGLLQFAPDSIAVISQGNATASPMMVTQLSEMTENRLVMFTGMSLVDTAEWTGMGSGFNARITDGGTDTITLRVDNDVNLFSMPAPLGTFSVSGWVIQYDASMPRDEGYSLSTCGMNMLTNSVEVENNSTQVSIFPNPAASVLNVQSAAEIENITVYNTLGQTVLNINNVNTYTTQIATRNLDNGVYIISVVTGNKVMTQQFHVVK
ncbi:MAG: Endonuclease i [uncultured Aureispira sp.]|uniref:Endonuclease i n=1 Tax=uncultured Aureispira sp. TaxID=1331704 RepID=A0A6S6UCI3_9BACT|nr:MAG: Endonuclease i [uncultured Aureispira sp.]